jgi:hypothetical protein
MKEEKSYFEHLKKVKSNIMDFFYELSVGIMPCMIVSFIGLCITILTDNVVYLFGSIIIGIILSMVFIDYRIWKRRPVKSK